MSENADFADEDFSRIMNPLFLFHHILILIVELYFVIRLIQSMVGINRQILQIQSFRAFRGHQNKFLSPSRPALLL